MKANKNFYVLVMVALLIPVMLFQSCSAVQVKDAKQTYAVALTTYADTVHEYNTAYAIQSPEVQAKWKATIAPKIHDGYKALTVWGKAIGTGSEEMAKGQYDAAFVQVISLLVDVGIIEVKK